MSESPASTVFKVQEGMKLKRNDVPHPDLHRTEFRFNGCLGETFEVGATVNGSKVLLEMMRGDSRTGALLAVSTKDLNPEYFELL